MTFFVNYSVLYSKRPTNVPERFSTYEFRVLLGLFLKCVHVILLPVQSFTKVQAMEKGTEY